MRATCEFVGAIDRSHCHPCTLRAQYAVWVNDISPLNVCGEHSRVMRKRYQPPPWTFGWQKLEASP